MIGGLQTAGLLFIRTRGLESSLVCAKAETDYNIVGIYWSDLENEPGTIPKHPYSLVDLLRGPTRLKISELFSIDTVEDTLILHPDVYKVAYWPFFTPDRDGVYRLALSWSMAQRKMTLEDFYSAPRTPMHILPMLRENGLALSPGKFPGTMLLDLPVDDSLTPVIRQSDNRDEVVALELAKLVAKRAVRVRAEEYDCFWCEQFRKVGESIIDTGRVPPDLVRVWTDSRTTDKSSRSALYLVSDDLREELKSMIASISSSLAGGSDIVPMGTLSKIARLFDIEIPDTIDRTLHTTTINTDAGRIIGTGHSGGLSTNRVLFIPLFGADVSSLDSSQLASLEEALTQPSHVIDPATHTLRSLVTSEILSRSRQSSNDYADTHMNAIADTVSAIGK